MVEESELAKVKRRIRSFAARAADAASTEGEAMLAMKKVGDLLTQFNLTMDEVALRDEPCVTKSFNTGKKKRNVVWEAFSGLKSLCGVKVWYNSGTRIGGMSWSFFGLESDVDMALYLCDVLTKAENTAVAEFQHSEVYKTFDGHRLTAVTNFKRGFGQRINERFYELARERVAAERKAADYHAESMASNMIEASEEAIVKAAAAKTGTALICVAKEKRIEEEFAKRGPKLRTIRSHSSGRYHHGARDAGRAAGNSVNLGRPVGGGSKPAGYLK